MEPLIDLIVSQGYLAVLAVIYAESGLLIGFFLPGDSLLFAAGFLVQQGVFTVNIHTFVLLLFVCAVLGQSTGYLFGRKVGRSVFNRENSRFFRKENMLRAEKFYEKHGPITIIVACFIPFVRTFVPIVAGVSKMPYHQFLIYNVVGAALWVSSFTYLGYYAGRLFHELGINVEIGALIIILLSVSPIFIHALKTKERRTAFLEATKRELKIIFSKNPNQ